MRRPNELVIDIPVSWIDECCIYKVPENLRNLNEQVYTPQLISIGPLHRSDKNLAGMAKHKENYLRKFCARPEMKLKDLTHLLKLETRNNVMVDFVRIYGEEQIEERIHNSYAIFNKSYTLQMILLDAIFIIELFLRDFKKVKEEERKELYQDDYLLKNQWLRNSIQQDLLLLENQLPYFFLKELYTLAFPDNHQPTFDELTWQFFKEYNRYDLPQRKILHFTDLLRYFVSHHHPVASKKTSRTKIQANAVKLHESGVEFEAIKKACLTDIKFVKGKLKGKLTMPQFDVDNTTERVIRNLIAFEQFHCSSESYISYYIFLMDCLIDTAKDVELLIEKGIIVNWLGSNEEVATLINGLYINITKCNSFYHEISDQLNNYYNSRLPRIMETLSGVYFSNFWRGTSTVAAIILLVLTLLQTVSSYLALR